MQVGSLWAPCFLLFFCTPHIRMLALPRSHLLHASPMEQSLLCCSFPDLPADCSLPSSDCSKTYEQNAFPMVAIPALYPTLINEPCIPKQHRSPFWTVTFEGHGDVLLIWTVGLPSTGLTHIMYSRLKDTLIKLERQIYC